MPKIKREDLMYSLNKIVEMHSTFLKIYYSLDIDMFSEDYKEYGEDIKEKCKDFMEDLLKIGEIINNINEDCDITVIDEDGNEIEKIPF